MNVVKLISEERKLFLAKNARFPKRVFLSRSLFQILKQDEHYPKRTVGTVYIFGMSVCLDLRLDADKVRIE